MLQTKNKSFPRGLENAHDAPFFKHVLPTFKISRASFPTTLCFVLHPKMNARIWSKRINGIIGERREANEPISPGSLLMDDQDKSDRNVSKNSINRGQKVNDWKKVFTCLSPPTVAEFEAVWLLSWLVRSPNGLRPRTAMLWGRLICRFSMTSTAGVTQIWK